MTARSLSRFQENQGRKERKFNELGCAPSFRPEGGVERGLGLKLSREWLKFDGNWILKGLRDTLRTKILGNGRAWKLKSFDIIIARELIESKLGWDFVRNLQSFTLSSFSSCFIETPKKYFLLKSFWKWARRLARRLSSRRLGRKCCDEFLFVFQYHFSFHKLLTAAFEWCRLLSTTISHRAECKINICRLNSEGKEEVLQFKFMCDNLWWILWWF